MGCSRKRTKTPNAFLGAAERELGRSRPLFEHRLPQKEIGLQPSGGRPELCLEYAPVALRVGVPADEVLRKEMGPVGIFVIDEAWCTAVTEDHILGYEVAVAPPRLWLLAAGSVTDPGEYDLSKKSNVQGAENWAGRHGREEALQFRLESGDGGGAHGPLQGLENLRGGLGQQGSVGVRS